MREQWRAFLCWVKASKEASKAAVQSSFAAELGSLRKLLLQKNIKVLAKHGRLQRKKGQIAISSKAAAELETWLSR